MTEKIGLGSHISAFSLPSLLWYLCADTEYSICNVRHHSAPMERPLRQIDLPASPGLDLPKCHYSDGLYLWTPGMLHCRIRRADSNTMATNTSDSLTVR